MAIYLEVVNLLKVEQVRDTYGDLINAYTSREVFAVNRSVYMREAYEAMSNGFKPELSFQLSDYYDYGDESLLEYGGKIFRIIRVDQGQEDKSLRLICERIVNDSEVYYASP